MTAANPAVAPALWSALRTAAKPASIAELQRATPGRHHQLSSRLRAWANAGLVDATPGVPVRFAIAPSAVHLAQPPRPGALGVDAWRALRRIGRPATLAELVAATGASDRPLYCRLFRWVRDGLLVRFEPTPELFTLTSDARDVAAPPALHRQKPRRMPTARARIWASMRVLKRFDVPILVMTAEVSRRACEDFISILGRAGYVKPVAHRATRHRAGNHGFARDYSTYQLLRNTGPKCPVASCRAEGGKFLFDRNTGQRIELVVRQPGRGREGRHDR